MIRIITLLTITLFSTLYSFSQENIKVMYYNLLKFPDFADRADTLKNIIQHVKPDVFIVNELYSSFGAGLIMTKALNVDGVSYYSQAVFQDANGNDTDNQLFYNHNKIGLKKQNNINTSPRALSEYILYYKDPNLAQTNDTTFLYFYGCHLKAADGVSEAAERGAAALALKNYLTNHNRNQNVIIGGDMNIYTNSESAYTNLTSGGTLNLYDPIAQVGAWHNSYTYRNVHTQSSRSSSVSSPYGGGSTGGLDDRFDMILVSNDIMNGSQGVKYVVNSYKAVGQDGDRFNGSVNDGTNASVPADVANSLFYMSDHLPVVMEVQVGGPLSVQKKEDIISNFSFDSNSKLMTLSLEKEFNEVTVQVFSLSGQQIESRTYNQTSLVSEYYSNLTAGIYLISIVADGQPVSAKIMVY